MKREILPIAGEGAYLQPRDYVPENAQTTDEPYEIFALSIGVSNFNDALESYFMPAVQKFLDTVSETIFKPFAEIVAEMVVNLEDEKQKQRQKVKDDVRNKRREMFKNRK